MAQRKVPARVAVMNRKEIVQEEPRDEMVCPESSNVLGATYYPNHLTLRVRFKRGIELTSIYEYENVTPDQWKQFKDAESKGKFINMLKKDHQGKQLVA